jgi:hypothetical protein
LTILIARVLAYILRGIEGHPLPPRRIDMKTLSLVVGWLVAGAAFLTWAGPAVAGSPVPPVQVPGPGTLTAVSTGIVVAVVAVRWLRGK